MTELHSNQTGSRRIEQLNHMLSHVELAQWEIQHKEYDESSETLQHIITECKGWLTERRNGND